MLKQILRDMKVEPELLEQLTEDQKQVLFAKLRQEQIRRWRLREADLEKQKGKQPPKKTHSKVAFLLGADQQPWVWVMGEHSNDVSYEELCKQREKEEQEREKVRELQDRIAAEEQAKLETAIVLDGKGQMKRSESAPPCMDHVKESPAPERKVEGRSKYAPLWKKAVTNRAALIGSSEAEKENFKKRRTQELFEVVQLAREVAKQRALQVSKKVEERWKESEEKAKGLERARKASFHAAQKIVTQAPQKVEEIFKKLPETSVPRNKGGLVRHVETSDSVILRKSSVVYCGTAPKTQAHVVQWFRESEAPKGVGLEIDGSISVWFHGLIDRDAAEKLLESKPVGTYLVRITTKLWGYTVSVKCYEESKHFMVDASCERYHFLGPKQREFNSISELLLFYRTNPITWSGQEMLIVPCGQGESIDCYKGLYIDGEDEDESQVTFL